MNGLPEIMLDGARFLLGRMEISLRKYILGSVTKAGNCNTVFPMSISLHEEHFRKFSNIDGRAHWIASRKPRSWAKSVGAPIEVFSALPNEKVTRTDLKQICANADLSPEQCFLAIMAWGGMKVEHGQRAWNVRENWAGIVEALRNGNLTRRDAYDRFRQFRQENPKCGIGPAFYTKVIFFASPHHDGYIMDQWTAKSIDLLVSGINGGSESIVWIDRSGYVSPRNESIRYEYFCRVTEELGSLLRDAGIEKPNDVEWGEFAEERMFSNGGRKRGEWRSYVVDKWSWRQCIDQTALPSLG